MRMHYRVLFIVAASSVASLGAQQPALRGLDPVALCRGRELPGDAAMTAEHEGYLYRFADAGNRATFVKEPARWSIQLGGACARMGPLSGRGDADRWTVHDERIYVFASDGCRTGFLKDPERCLDLELPAPRGDEQQHRDGRQLLLRAMASHGAVSWRTLRYTTRREQGKGIVVNRVEVLAPDSQRIETEYRQPDGVWHYGNVVSPSARFFLEEDRTRTMAEAAARAMLRDLRREPLAAFSCSDRAVVVVGEKRSVAGVEVEEFEFWLDGAVTTFGVGADGLIRTARFRGRGPDLRFTEIVRVYDDFATVAGVIVPQTVRVQVGGQPDASLTEHREGIEVDVEVAAERFQPPK